MEKNSRTEMLPGKRDFYRCCKARRGASHVNKEFLTLRNAGIETDPIPAFPSVNTH